ncbi:rhodanese-like domain-containing protein [Rhodobacteraceae bacterium KMM 6894]|nr:rhodanese-like domain-containing protein [Rhodobacteraceae bacterium KMM 6894]
MKTEDLNGKTLETWTVDEVAKAWDAGDIVLIDVRSPQEFAMEHVIGAMLMPMASFDGTKLPSQQGKRIVLMCGSGIRSEKMARAALEAGESRIAHLEGGFGAWKAAELPFVGTDMATGGPQKMNQR